MTQHEYVMVAISIILGLAITRMLHTVGSLIRAHRRVEFHWATAAWSLCVMAYSLQFWWVGWELRDLEYWSFASFGVLTIGAICVYGAAEMALPVPEEGQALDFLGHSQGLGRLSALSMLLYLCIGPYVNIALFGNEVVVSLLLPLLGVIITGLMMAIPKYFQALSVAFTLYTTLILYLTA